MAWEEIKQLEGAVVVEGKGNNEIVWEVIAEENEDYYLLEDFVVCQKMSNLCSMPLWWQFIFKFWPGDFCAQYGRLKYEVKVENMLRKNRG